MPPRSSIRPDATPPLAWIHVPLPDRMTLERVRTQIDFPAEFMTYCLLAHRRPKIIPCAAWLYSAWQVPLPTGDGTAGGAGGAVRLEEVKACVGPQVFVTVFRTRSRRTAGQLEGLLPARDTATPGAGGQLLVALVERITEAYRAVAAELSDRSFAVSRHPTARARDARRGMPGWLRRHLAEHAAALRQLRARGARWLDAAAREHLDDLASRPAAIDVGTSSEATDPEAS